MGMRSIWPELEPHTPGRRPSGVRSQQTTKAKGSAWAPRPSGMPWSYSRRSAFERCPRQYYYEYYGAGVRTARDEPEKAVLRQLKGLANRHERVGELLHLGITTNLRKAQQGTALAPSGLGTWLGAMLKGDIAYSRKDPDGLAPLDQRYPPKLLREFHYRQ